jgi:putative transposase
MKTYTIRLFPTSEQICQLKELSNIQIDIWNTLLILQQNKYQKEKKIFTKYDLINLLPNLKKTEKIHWNVLNSKSIQSVVVQFYSSYISFFKLYQKDKTRKLPKIKTSGQFQTLIYNQSGWKFKSDNIIRINQINFKYKSHFKTHSRIKYKRNSS